ncbi:D-glycero-alpha-D-manno-heptose-1,7-bisphosphate 7-phosphatase [mine drainage metagenome]|uniref:D,D-heptose 1,7-bisphosphate phosphatase n=1 Tax=mine drainage metagenome TaxID=410659 RepID=A0A1J5RIS7_9ZZZZ
MDLKQINKSWTLFLDRDGVINYEKKDEYVLHWDEFIFMPGVKDALKILNGLFGVIVIVTNQKCIGKKLLTTEGLQLIHQNMLDEIKTAGGRVDNIYFCPDLEDDSPNRKPNHGMALQAKHDFPQIDFSKSMMVGNKLSDMQFARNAGIASVFAATTNPDTAFPHPLIDLRVNDLLDFATALTKA